MVVVEVQEERGFWVGKAIESFRKGWKEAVATRLRDFPVFEGHPLQI